RVWQEHYYLIVLGMALLCLFWYYKRYTLVLASLLMVTLMPESASAATLQDYFLNSDQQGRALLDRGAYTQAESAFSTPYRRGAAAYRAGHYDAAEKSFAVAAASAVPQALYNMANAQMMEGKYRDAVRAYEAVLKSNRKDAEARHNLDIARKLLEQQKKKE